MNFLDAIVLLFSGQGLFLAFLLYNQKKIKANPWLSFFFASFSLISIYWVIWWSHLPFRYKLIDFSVELQLLLGPFLYLSYTRAKSKVLYSHFIPAAVALLINLPSWFWFAFQIHFSEIYLSSLRYSNLFFLGFTIIFNGYYSILVFKKSHLSEYKILASGLLLFTLGTVTYQVMDRSGFLTRRLDYIMSLIIIVGFYYSGYFYFFKYRPYSKKINGDVGSSQDFDSDFSTLVDSYLRQQKSFLDPNYKIEQLSIDLAQPARKISTVIRNSGANNFSEFINRYRIEEAKKLLAESNDKILAVALESGFSNKVTLIENFKKFCNQTPGEYRKSIRNGN